MEFLYDRMGDNDEIEVTEAEILSLIMSQPIIYPPSPPIKRQSSSITTGWFHTSRSSEVEYDFTCPRYLSKIKIYEERVARRAEPLMVAGPNKNYKIVLAHKGPVDDY